MDKNEELFAIEIKSGKKIDPGVFKNLKHFQKQKVNVNGLVIYGGKEYAEINSQQFVLPWNEI
ncbi:hypothetical protein, partial [Escherichia coli]|uniref:hypothetical protein n=1 Tax=Escherichia coli TaxID=562 RepID=UPI0039E1BF42